MLPWEETAAVNGPSSAKAPSKRLTIFDLPLIAKLLTVQCSRGPPDAPTRHMAQPVARLWRDGASHRYLVLVYAEHVEAEHLCGRAKTRGAFAVLTHQGRIRVEHVY